MVIQVTAAIFYQDGKYLICQRAYDDTLPLLWKLPDGKAEDGETLEQRIIRECQEELGVDIEVCGEVGKTGYPNAGSDLEFAFFNTEIVAGTLAATMLDPAALPTRGL